MKIKYLLHFKFLNYFNIESPTKNQKVINENIIVQNMNVLILNLYILTVGITWIDKMINNYN